MPKILEWNVISRSYLLFEIEFLKNKDVMSSVLVDLNFTKIKLCRNIERRTKSYTQRILFNGWYIEVLYNIHNSIYKYCLMFEVEW